MELEPLRIKIQITKQTFRSPSQPSARHFSQPEAEDGNFFIRPTHLRDKQSTSASS